MSDSTATQPSPENDHFTNALNTWKQSREGDVSKKDEERVLGIRDAVQARDRKRVEDELRSAKEQSNWLYEELMKHPEISAIFRELAIMGF